MQDLGELLYGGLSGEVASELRFSEDGQHFFYANTSSDVIAFECLAQVLSNIVLADTCYVDADNSEAWLPHFPALARLTQKGFVQERLFNHRREHWVEIREAIVEQFTTCPELKSVHEENKRAHREKRPLPDELLSAVLHGGAGMMARARFAEVPYISHPLRERLVENADFMKARPSARSELTAFVESQRLRLFERIDSTGYYARLRLPPIAIQVINESNSAENLLEVAVQMRERYRTLREWLSEFQDALSAEDISEIQGRHRMLSQLGMALDGQSLGDTLGITTVQMGATALPKLTFKVGALVNSIRNQFGVRAQLNRILLTEPGSKAVKRLCGFFDQSNGKYALDLEHDLQKRWGAAKR